MKIQVRVFFQSEKLMKFRCQAEFQKFWLFVDDIFFIMSIFWKWHLISERGTLNFIQYLSKELNFKSKKILTLEEKLRFLAFWGLQPYQKWKFDKFIELAFILVKRTTRFRWVIWNLSYPEFHYPRDTFIWFLANLINQKWADPCAFLKIDPFTL